MIWLKDIDDVAYRYRWCSFIHSFLRLYSASSRDYYTDALPAQSWTKKDFRERCKIWKGGPSEGAAAQRGDHSMLMDPQPKKPFVASAKCAHATKSSPVTAWLWNTDVALKHRWCCLKIQMIWLIDTDDENWVLWNCLDVRENSFTVLISELNWLNFQLFPVHGWQDVSWGFCSAGFDGFTSSAPLRKSTIRFLSTISTWSSVCGWLCLLDHLR